MFTSRQTQTSYPAWTAALAIGCAALFTALPSSAQLLLNNSVIEFEANQAMRTIEMRNTGTAPILVSIDLQEVLAPGTLGPMDEVTMPVKPAILKIEPNHFELLPSDKVTVAIHHTVRNLQDDEAYRLLVTPKSTSQTTGFNISLNYDLMLLVRPNNSEPKVRLIKTTEGFAFENHGNTNALLTKLQVCDESIKQCKSLPSKRLYAEQRWPITLPKEFNTRHTQIKTHQLQRGQYEHIDYAIPMAIELASN